jgi:hypothetical protein
MGPQHTRAELPSIKICRAKRCPDLIEKTLYSKKCQVCQLTDRLPGKMPECPRDTGMNCCKLQGCPLLRTGMPCSRCMMKVNSAGCA